MKTLEEFNLMTVIELNNHITNETGNKPKAKTPKAKLSQLAYDKQQPDPAADDLVGETPPADPVAPAEPIKPIDPAAVNEAATLIGSSNQPSELKFANKVVVALGDVVRAAYKKACENPDIAVIDVGSWNSLEDADREACIQEVVTKLTLKHGEIDNSIAEVLPANPEPEVSPPSDNSAADLTVEEPVEEVEQVTIEPTMPVKQEFTRSDAEALPKDIKQALAHVNATILISNGCVKVSKGAKQITTTVKQPLHRIVAVVETFAR